MNKQPAILLTAALLLLSGCGAVPPEQKSTSESFSVTPQSSSQTSVPEANSLSLYPAAVNLPVGRELKLKATVSPVSADLTWASSDETVAAVDNDGLVTVIAPGECSVTVTSGSKCAECAVLAEEDCRTVIFAAKPIKSDGEDPPQPPDGAKGETPIELPPDVTDTGKIPTSDEFIWTLEFDKPFATTVTNDGISLTANVSIVFKAEKQGGKTALGSYTGVFSGDADLDRENFLEVMNEQMAVEGGKLTDYTENDEGLQEVPVTLEVTAMDDDAYHEVMFGHIPEKDRSITQQLPIPISKLLPGSMMALGDVSGMVTVSGTMTVSAGGQSITAPFGTTKSSNQPYTICIYTSGEAVLTFPLMSSGGFDRDWVEGTLTKRPLM